MLKLAALLFLLAMSSPLAEAVDWGYVTGSTNLPATWNNVNALCGNGGSQSPLNIVTADAVAAADDAITWTGYSTTPSDATMTLKNTGHFISVDLASASNGYKIRGGGGLTDDYYTTSFHFHWGSTSSDTVGAEHKLDSSTYPAELHVVSYNSSYADYATARDSGDEKALAVFAWFLEIQTSANTALNIIVNNIGEVYNETDAEYLIPANDEFTLDSILPAAKTNYYRYSGSLTTPNCQEVVQWYIFEDTIKISKAQLHALMNGAMYSTAASGTSMVGNYRPVQTLGSRTVYKVGSAQRIMPVWQVLVAAIMCVVATYGRQ